MPNNWLFRFVKVQGQKEYLIYLTDISAFPERFNEFQLTEGTDVTFDNKGEYVYTAYQMPNGGSLDYTLGTLVETGLCVVYDDPQTKTEFNTTITTKVHE